MKSIMIHREGKDYGPYSLEEVQGLLAKALLNPDDLAWVDGGTEWVPLRDLIPKGMPGMREKLVASAKVAAPASAAAQPTPPLVRKGTMIGLSLIALLAFIIVPVIYELKEAVAPILAFVPTKPSTSPDTQDINKLPLVPGGFFVISAQVEGDSITATIMTDNTNEAQLCDEVMNHIYTLAKENSSANTLSCDIQVKGKKEVTLKIQDLGAVRSYPDKKAYATSEHRSFVEGRLKDAGLAVENSSVRDPASGDAAGSDSS